MIMVFWILLSSFTNMRTRGYRWYFVCCQVLTPWYSSAERNNVFVCNHCPIILKCIFLLGFIFWYLIMLSPPWQPNVIFHYLNVVRYLSINFRILVSYLSIFEYSSFIKLIESTCILLLIVQYVLLKAYWSIEIPLFDGFIFCLDFSIWDFEYLDQSINHRYSVCFSFFMDLHFDVWYLSWAININSVIYSQDTITGF